jgi:hypothetical protein
MRRALAVSVALVVCASPVRAEWLNYAFTGKVITADGEGDALPPGIKAGSTFTGTFALDVNRFNAAGISYAYGLAENVRVVVDGTYALDLHRTDSSRNIPGKLGSVWEETGGGGTNFSFYLSQDGPGGISASRPPLRPSYSSMGLSVDLSGQTNAITSARPGHDTVDLSKLFIKSLNFMGWQNEDGRHQATVHLVGELTSLTAIPSPEPTSLALLTLGGAGLAAARWRRSRGRT